MKLAARCYPLLEMDPLILLAGWDPGTPLPNTLVCSAPTSKRVVQSIPTLKKHVLSRLRWARSAQFVWTSWVQPGLRWSKYSASKLNCLSHLRSSEISESSSTPRCSNDASHGNCCATSRCMFQLDWTTREIQRIRVRCMSCMSCMLGF